MKELILNPDLVTEDTIANVFAPIRDGSIKHLYSASKVTLDNLPEIIVEKGLIDMQIIQKEFRVKALPDGSYKTYGPKLILQMEDGTIYDNLAIQETSLGISPERRVEMSRIVLLQKE